MFYIGTLYNGLASVSSLIGEDSWTLTTKNSRSTETKQDKLDSSNIWWVENYFVLRLLPRALCPGCLDSMSNVRPHRNLGLRTSYTLRSGYYCSRILSDQTATNALKRIKLHDDLYAQSKARCRFNNRPATALDGRRDDKIHRCRETKVWMALGLPQVWKVRSNVGWYHPPMRRLPLRSSTL